MKKHFRKIPEFISLKINGIKSNLLTVSTTISVREDEISSEQYANLGLSIKGGDLIFTPEFVPATTVGRYSKKNALGFTIIRRDLRKVYKTIDLGERPYFGDWSKGSFNLLVSKLVYQREQIPPKELTLGLELLESPIIDGRKTFILKVKVNDILNKEGNDFNDRLLFDINLLQENIYKVDVFDSEADINDYLSSFHVTWEFFPPGNRESDIERILSGYIGPIEKLREQLTERYDFLMTLHPKSFIYGLSGIRRYFGAQFLDDLVVFDNLQYGNAIYVLFENWKELSKLSRTEILKRPEKDYVWIKHSLNWKAQLKKVVEDRLKTKLK